MKFHQHSLIADIQYHTNYIFNKECHETYF